MIRIRRPFILVMALLVLMAVTVPVAFAQDPDNGQALWEGQIWQCQRCHGPMGEGLFGPPLAGNEKTTAEWIEQVRTPRRFMPSFSPEQVSDEQITDIHAYLTSLTMPAEFTPKDAGTAENPGQNVMLQARCVACHTEANGEVGFLVEGVIERGGTLTAESVINQLRTPFKDMPSFSEEQVSDENATVIADYLAGLVAAQAPPSALPQSGGPKSATLPVASLLLGGGLLLTGFILRRLIVRA